jgi:hypothetical protein
MVVPDAARGDRSVPDGPIDFASGPAAQWRRELVSARIRLADEGLNAAERAALWSVVDWRERCLKLLVDDFDAELERIDRLIEAELRR